MDDDVQLPPNTLVLCGSPDFIAQLTNVLDAAFPGQFSLRAARYRADYLAGHVQFFGWLVGEEVDADLLDLFSPHKSAYVQHALDLAREETDRSLRQLRSIGRKRAAAVIQRQVELRRAGQQALFPDQPIPAEPVRPGRKSGRPAKPRAIALVDSAHTGEPVKKQKKGG